MKKYQIKFSILTIIVLIVGMLSSGCGCRKVPAGHVGIKVYLLGSDKGVDTEELKVGRYWIGINEELYLFPTFQQNYVWTASEDEGSPNDESFLFQTKEGLEVGADIGISYHIDPLKVNTIFQKYRRGVDEITDIFLRNMVRDALNNLSSKLEVESIYGIGKQQLLTDVQTLVQEQVKEQGIIVDKIYAIGNFRLPQQVTNALNAKIEATQRAQQRENEVQEARAQAEKAKAEAEGIRVKQQLENSTLTPAILQKMWIEKWNGQLPTLLTGNNASNFLMQIPSK
ncbi:MAG: prohibitin family protein [Asgard group archaeon]|nr:prohibitin family protein [Asgard group archaeon]